MTQTNIFCYQNFSILQFIVIKLICKQTFYIFSCFNFDVLNSTILFLNFYIIPKLLQQNFRNQNNFCSYELKPFLVMYYEICIIFINMLTYNYNYIIVIIPFYYI